eukprot:1536021-Ditylum_brightwellii.AAC.1
MSTQGCAKLPTLGSEQSRQRSLATLVVARVLTGLGSGCGMDTERVIEEDVEVGHVFIGIRASLTI